MHRCLLEPPRVIHNFADAVASLSVMKHDRLFDDTSSRAAASTNRFQCRDRQLGRLRVRALLDSEGRHAHGHIVVIQRHTDRHVERHWYHDHQNQQALEHPQHRRRLGAPRRRVRLLRVESSWFRESIDNFDRQRYDLLIPPHGSRYNRLYIIIITNLKYPSILPLNHPSSLPKDLLTKQDTYSIAIPISSSSPCCAWLKRMS